MLDDWCQARTPTGWSTVPEVARELGWTRQRLKSTVLALKRTDPWWMDQVKLYQLCLHYPPHPTPFYRKWLIFSPHAVEALWIRRTLLVLIDPKRRCQSTLHALVLSQMRRYRSPLGRFLTPHEQRSVSRRARSWRTPSPRSTSSSTPRRWQSKNMTAVRSHMRRALLPR